MAPEPHRRRVTSSTFGRSLLLAVLAALTLALLPSAASAQSGSCTVELTATQDPAVGTFSVDCDPNTITRAEIGSSETGSIEEGTGTECRPNGRDTNFTCEPTRSSSLVTGRFRAADDDVCDRPRLELTVSVTTGAGSDEVGDVEIRNCSASSPDGADSDDEDVPEGGIDTGAGGTADSVPTDWSGARFAALALVTLAVVAGALALRRGRAR